MGATRRNLQAQPKILKNEQNTNSTNQNENFCKKNYISYLKSVKEQKFVWGLPDGICKINPKSLQKIIRAPNLPIKTKKVCLVT
jgi:hypothetical protein